MSDLIKPEFQRLTLSEIIQHNIRETINEFCELNNCSFDVDISLEDKGTGYDGFGWDRRTVDPRVHHYLTIKLTQNG